MTKQTIIDDLIKLYSPKELQKEKVVKEIQYKSMDIYAKQEVISFNKWREQRAARAIQQQEILVMPKTFEKLYELYLKSKESVEKTPH